MKRPLLLPALLAAGLVACGSDDAGPSGDDSDIRAKVLACLTEEQGLDASLEGAEGEEEIVFAGEGERPRIRFFLTAGEAEAAQFEGEGEGAEQIGAALLFVDPALSEEDEDLVAGAEQCLADQ